MRRAVVAAVAMSALTALTGCDSAPSEVAEAPVVAGAPAAVLDVTALPAGAPPEVAYLAGGELHWRGRTVATDFPADALYLRLLGPAGGRLVVTAFQQARGEAGTRFWSIDADGHARRLGRAYESQQYPPRLVPSTGHLWVYAADRTTPWTIWELDARTGRELATYREPAAPQGLAAADRALVDVWLAGGTLDDQLSDRTRDGTREVDTRATLDGTGNSTAHLRVRATADGARLGRFAFALGTEGSVAAVAFEDREHVLALVTVSYSRRGDEQVIVRCSLADQTCERATEVGGSMALRIGSRFRPD